MDNDFKPSKLYKELRNRHMRESVFEFLAMLISAGFIYVLMWMSWSMLGN